MRHSLDPMHPNTEAQSIARGLGWFSIAFGVGELLAPRRLKRGTGAPGPAGLFQFYGLREIATGVAILASRRPVAMLWGRVAGDIVDIASLAPATSRHNPHRAGGTAALALVLAITALDVFVALQGDETN